MAGDVGLFTSVMPQVGRRMSASFWRIIWHKDVFEEYRKPLDLTCFSGAFVTIQFNLYLHIFINFSIVIHK